MAIHESITQDARTRIHWTMVLVEDILVVQRLAVIDPHRRRIVSCRDAYCNHVSDRIGGQPCSLRELDMDHEGIAALLIV